MSDTARDANDVAAYYARGGEGDRFDAGPGALEFLRTRILLERYLPPAPATVADIGGGPGRYATWLAERGYKVHLVDLVPLHIEQAREAERTLTRGALASAEVGDARALRLADGSVDAVLVLGPLYHLPTQADRVKALAEARRVCRDGGIVFAAAISRFASTLDGLRNGYLEDSAFAAIAERDRLDGQHRNPTGDPAYFTTAFFHHPAELAAEFGLAGLAHESTLAIEGPGWLLADLDARLADEDRRTSLLRALEAIESEPSLLGVSPHLLAVGRRASNP
jgi:SAM-dependent methyltransferase